MRRKLLLIFAAAVLAVFGCIAINLSAIYERVKMDRSFPALSRYVFEPTPGIVLVGSSMTFRLYEGYFETPVRNLAIGGGSALTGLAIVASFKKLPRTILVESTILSRPVDQALVSAFNSTGPLPWFRAVVSKVYYWIKYRSEDVPALLNLTPEETDISEPVSAAERDYNSNNHDAEMKANIETMKNLIRELERRGCRIMLFEMPFPPPLAQSHYAVMARNLTRAAFMDQKWINPIPQQKLGWLDAAHLNERSAALVAQEINKAIRAP